ncbi:unnamed protein product [Owenia fusiformis]|uniref:54 kDa nucleoporin n=1 Tax=Owenia fusiformis TaxID=6347 RepID=A0A8J1TFS5_OWEFU|nr:unnamed protein product [Owenia fusiformis]
MAFSFGANKTGFGATTTATSAPAFGGFGATAATSTATGTSFGFGAAKTTAPTLGFGTASTASTGFGGKSFAFGAGTTPATTATTGFGTTGGFGTTTGFGTGTGFGVGLASTGTGTSTGSLFGGTSTALGTNTGFGVANVQPGSTFGLGAQAQQQQTQQQQAANAMSNMAQAVSLPIIFGDERDLLIAKWNQLQAFWGSGKGFFSQNGVVEFTPDNPFCRFKAIGYSLLPTSQDTDGLVGIVFNKKESEIKALQQQLVDSLHKILGNKPTLSVCVEGVRQLPDEKTEVILYVLERPAQGPTKRITATELYNFMMSNNIKTQLISQLGVTNLVPKIQMTADQFKQYLDVPPSGIDPLLWQQAKLDNPDPEKLIPVPMVGFKELHNRLKHQEQQTSLHQARLDMIAKDISDLQRSHTNMVAKTEQYKRKHLELGHRVLQVMTKQEICRKMGYAIQLEEEQLRVNLEALQAELNAPTQFKGRLNELMSQIRMQNQLVTSHVESSYQVDNSVQGEIKQHLKQQQEGLQYLIEIIKDDFEDLKLIEQGLSESTRR